MAIRKIVQLGDPILRKKAFEVVDFGKRTSELLDDMKETLRLSGGVGLAAPQVGVLRRIFIIDLEEEGYFEFVNPRILSREGKQTGEEGCLSVRGKYGTVERPMTVKVTASDRNGKVFTKTVDGWFARAVSHEYDHLDGIIYLDKAQNVRDAE